MEEEILISYRGVNIDQKEYNILSDIDFDIRKGEFVYLIGKVGSGKSSFLKTIYGELNISQERQGYWTRTCVPSSPRK